MFVTYIHVNIAITYEETFVHGLLVINHALLYDKTGTACTGTCIWTKLLSPAAGYKQSYSIIQSECSLYRDFSWPGC